MAERVNEFTISGTLYDKPIRKWTSEAKGTSGSFLYYILDIPTPTRWNDDKTGKERSTIKYNLVKFLLPKGFDPAEFEIKDEITIDFKLDGHEYAKRDGSGKDYGLELKATRISFSDINRRHVNRDKVFVTPDQKMSDIPTSSADENLDDLPFIITILIGLGSLMSFYPF